MPQAKSTVRRKRRSKSVPLLRAAGLSLSLVAGPPTAIEASTADVPRSSLSPSHELLHEEEITDFSLATFHILEKEITPRRGTRLSGGCGACGAGLYAVPTVLGPERPKRRQSLEEQQAPRNSRIPKNTPVPKSAQVPRQQQQVPKNLYQNANRPAQPKADTAAKAQPGSAGPVQQAQRIQQIQPTEAAFGALANQNAGEQAEPKTASPATNAPN